MGFVIPNWPLIDSSLKTKDEFKFKPGSAVIFNSKEYHKGESPSSEIYNWQRITCNILVGEND